MIYDVDVADKASKALRARAAEIAELAVAQKKVKQALAACRTAGQRLAQARSLDVYGTATCRDRDPEHARALIELALTEHEHVEVVVLICPK